jgi:hypothetical protein
MAKQLTNLTVFASGPSDTEFEKGALRKVVAHLAEILEKSHGITLRLVTWPETVRPGISSDPQSVINEQIGRDYDIYIGILGTRFGQPTPRAESGTEEEFDAALGRFRSSNSVRVMFYFKRTEIDPYTLDILQMQRVMSFRERLGSRGVLYTDFKDTSEFVEVATKHLHNLIIDEWKDGSWISTIKPAESEILGKIVTHQTLPEPDTLQGGCASASNEDDDLGLFELLQDLHTRSQTLVGLITRIGTHTSTMAEQIQTWATEANSLLEQAQRIDNVGGSRQHQLLTMRAVDTVNKAADNISQYSAALAPDLKLYQMENRIFFDNLGRTVLMRHECQPSAELLEADIASLRNLTNVLETGLNNTKSFQLTVMQIPSLTGKLKKARKRTSAALGEFIAELQFSLQEGKKLLITFEDLSKATNGEGRSKQETENRETSS